MIFLCAEEGGGCGVLWTLTFGNRRAVQAESQPWAWCPDCQLEAA